MGLKLDKQRTGFFYPLNIHRIEEKKNVKAITLVDNLLGQRFSPTQFIKLTFFF
jgi:hypothetical protein